MMQAASTGATSGSVGFNTDSAQPGFVGFTAHDFSSFTVTFRPPAFLGVRADSLKLITRIDKAGSKGKLLFTVREFRTGRWTQVQPNVDLKGGPGIVDGNGWVVVGARASGGIVRGALGVRAVWKAR